MTVVPGVIRFVRHKRWPSWWMISDHLMYQWPCWWMLSDSSNVVMTVVIVWLSWLVAPEDPSKGYDHLDIFSWWWTFWLYCLCCSFFRDPLRSYFVVILRLNIWFLPFPFLCMMSNNWPSGVTLLFTTLLLDLVYSMYDGTEGNFD